LSSSCDEFLIHAVDVEGKQEGVEKNLVSMLGDWGKKTVTYAGGVHNYEDLELLKTLGKNRVNVTIGSALDLFGGPLSFERVLAEIKKAAD
jgi:phosphoribosylformimino-5-aminoimidazole carboxamide ribotide isomerase